MKKMVWTLLTGFALLSSGCNKEDPALKEKEETLKPTFMFWCFRKEIVESEYHIPEMDTKEEAVLLQNRIKGVTGYVTSEVNLEENLLTIKYAGSQIRKMNFEEAIAMTGFDVNFRPGYDETPNPTMR